MNEEGTSPRNSPRVGPQDCGDVLNIIVPSPLRSVSPFLEEAQCILRGIGDDAAPQKLLVISIFCIDQALRMVAKFTLATDGESEAIVEAFRKRRDELAVTCGRPLFSMEDATPPNLSKRDSCSTREGVTDADTNADSNSASTDFSAEDILIAEATSTLAVADREHDEGEHVAAARNYHTATIYFRVLQSMVPRLTPRVQNYLKYAAARTQETSPLYHNLVHEHFDGMHCVDVYEIVENKRLGKVRIGTDTARVYVAIFRGVS
jgi:hypothetical protein